MNDRQLKSFLMVAEKGSLSMAAEQLFISVQALRQQIGLLEKDVGVSLFERNSKGVSLTSAGQKFLERAKQIIELHETSINETRKLAEKREELRVSVFINPLLPVILEISAEFSKQYPGIKQLMIPSAQGNGSIFHDLDKGIIDIFEYPFIEHHTKWLDFTPLYSSRTFCLLSSSHHLSENQRIDIGDLCGEQVLIYNKKLHPGLMKCLHENNIDIALEEYPGGYLDEQSGPVIPDIISRCLSGCIFLVPEEYSKFFPSLRRIPLDPEIAWTFGLFHKKDADLTTRLFIETAKDLFHFS